MARPHELHKMLCQAFEPDTSPHDEPRAHNEEMRPSLLELIARHKLNASQVAVLAILRDLKRPISKKAISEILGLTERQAGNILNRLVDLRLVAKTLAERAGRGRPSSVYSSVNFGNAFPEITDFRKPASGNGLPEMPISGNEATEIPRPAKESPPTPPIRKNLTPTEKPESLPHNNHQVAAREAVAAVAAVDWKGRLDWIHREHSKAFNPAVGGTRHWSVLSNICHPVKGEPCDWDLDVVPAIVELAAQFEAKGQLMTTFELVRTVALRKRDARVSGNPEPTAPPPRLNGKHQPPRYTEAKPQAWMIEMEERIRRERSGAQ